MKAVQHALFAAAIHDMLVSVPWQPTLFKAMSLHHTVYVLAVVACGG